MKIEAVTPTPCLVSSSCIYKMLNDFLYSYSETTKRLSLQIPRILLNLQESVKLFVIKNYPKYPRKLSLREQFEESVWSAMFRFLKRTVDRIVKSSILAHARNLLEFENRPCHIVELNPLGIQSL